MSLTKEDLKNIKELFVEKFEEIDMKFENLQKIMEINFKLIAKHLEKLEKDVEYLKEQGKLYELTFKKIDKRLESIDKNILELRARENLNRDRLDRVELRVDDVVRVVMNSDSLVKEFCDKEKKGSYTKKK
jgi:septal ring factor EnvC (AmiA/AmiB activator)